MKFFRLMMLFFCLGTSQGAWAKKCMVNRMHALFDTEKSQANQKANRLSKMLSYHPRPVEPYEFKKFGTIVKSSKNLQNLEDGEYVVMADTQKRMAFAPRYPHLQGEAKELLVTHPALWEQLKGEFGPGIKPAFAGEFVILGGEVYQVTNKSGRWHGTQVHLDFGIKTLKEKGLKINQDTLFKEFDALERQIRARAKAKGIDLTNDYAMKGVRDPNHLNEKETVHFMMTEMLHHPLLAQQFIEYREVYKKIYRNPLYRGKGGKVDLSKVEARLVQYANDHPDDEMTVYTVANLYLERVAKESNIHFFPFREVFKQGPEELKRGLEILQKIAEDQ